MQIKLAHLQITIMQTKLYKRKPNSNNENSTDLTSKGDGDPKPTKDFNNNDPSQLLKKKKKNQLTKIKS